MADRNAKNRIKLMAAAVAIYTSVAGNALAPVGEPVERIDLMDGLSTWEALDERRLVLTLGADQNYLVTLSRSCHALPFATHLGVSASNNTVYAGFDYITADGERCAINTINELSSQQRRALLHL